MPKYRRPFRAVPAFGGLYLPFDLVKGPGKGGAAPAGLSFVQTGNANFADSGNALTIFPANTTPGNVVILVVVSATPSDTITFVSSSIGTFSAIVNTVTGNGNTMQGWICTDVTGAAATATFDCAVLYAAAAIELTGATYSAVYGSTAHSASSETPAITITPAGENDFLMAALSSSNQGSAFSPVPSSPWTNVDAGQWGHAYGNNYRVRGSTIIGTRSGMGINGWFEFFCHCGHRCGFDVEGLVLTSSGDILAAVISASISVGSGLVWLGIKIGGLASSVKGLAEWVGRIDDQLNDAQAIRADQQNQRQYDQNKRERELAKREQRLDRREHNDSGGGNNKPRA